MAHTIHDADWPQFKKLMAAWISGQIPTGPRRRPPRPVPGSRPPIRAILLEDLESGAAVDAAVTARTIRREIQTVSIEGEITGGVFRLKFQGGTTVDLDPDATAAEVQAALEGLAAINPGDVIVEDFPGRWLISWTGQFEGLDVESLTAENGLEGFPNTIRITDAWAWEDTGRTETVYAAIPMGSPTPLIAGAVVVAEWIPEGAGFCVIAAEPRELNLDLSEASYY